jgi:hypothetical protein
MTIAAALLLTVLSSGAYQDPVSLPTSTGETTATGGTSAGRQQIASGIITSGEVGDRTAISDSQQRQQPRYNAPDDEPGRPQVQGGVPGNAPLPHHAPSLDSRHRIEVRFGGWGDGWYEGHGDNWDYAGSAKGAFGLEYLSFIRNDIGIGVGFSSLVRADDCHECFESGAARVVTSVPVIVRWYPVRRLTRSRLVEPYVTGGIGPVFGVDTIYSRGHEGGAWYHDEYSSTRVGTTFGGRVGGGVDFCLGRIFTLGVSGAWNWDSGFSNDLWRAARPSGGEFTVALGWNFGRYPSTQLR